VGWLRVPAREPAAAGKTATDPNGPEDSRRTFPIRSRPATAWVMNLLFDEGRQLLAKKELEKVMLILEWKGLDNPGPAVGIDLPEKDPVLAAIVALVEMQREWNGTATDLLDALKEVGVLRRIILRSDKRWPPDGSQLSRRLGLYKDWLLKVGIVADLHRVGHKREHRLMWKRDLDAYNAEQDEFLAAAAAAAKEREIGPQNEKDEGGNGKDELERVSEAVDFSDGCDGRWRFYLLHPSARVGSGGF